MTDWKTRSAPFKPILCLSLPIKYWRPSLCISIFVQYDVPMVLLGGHMKTMASENLDEFCFMSLLIVKKCRHESHDHGELEGQFIVLPVWFVISAIFYEIIEYVMKVCDRDWSCNSWRVSVVEIRLGSLKVLYLVGLGQ